MLKLKISGIEPKSCRKSIDISSLWATRYFEIRLVPSPEEIMQLMAQCIVLRAEMLYESQSIHYTAHSEMFDVVSTGQIIPMYVIIIHNHPEGRKTFSAKRVEEPKVSPYYY